MSEQTNTQTKKKPSVWSKLKLAWRKNQYYRGEQTATVRISYQKVNVNTVAAHGPVLFGFRPLRWLYTAYHTVVDYLFVGKHGNMLKAPIYKELTRRVINHPRQTSMQKIGEIDKLTNKTHTL